MEIARVQQTYSVKVQESSQVGEARRLACSLAMSLGFDESDTGRVALIVTELGTNLVKHTENQGGELLLQCVLNQDQTQGLEIIGLDQGPGISNISLSMRDGHSTAGSPGQGLGAIDRLSTYFEIFSRIKQGTAILSRVFKKGLQGIEATFLNIGGVCLPFHGEKLSGDLWSYHRGNLESSFLLADGLGHGLLAHEAAKEAVRIFEETPRANLEQLFKTMHAAMRKTRGAAVSSLKLKMETRTVQYMGIGNVSAAIANSQKTFHLVNLNGIVGHEIRKLQEFQYSFEKGSILILYSDGLSNKWDFNVYPGLFSRHPSLIAAVLYRDHKRTRDDITVVVAKEGRT